ncbi:hypothetical protein CROQUDRAFT_92463 [Cronartium quercuum f. sp. fusiforme G11]|uniref:Uncharacterized protein n=1 Tax=Cronartium quercuum f. sp. fusiforme G11 TaxID=708437 RepID=A0A9P6NJA6_9BASI|nr:hypothetical protein CROQUDRAFT_92463 [Cronartium quercuum f. sp. fusiforme G11]
MLCAINVIGKPIPSFISKEFYLHSKPIDSFEYKHGKFYKVPTEADINFFVEQHYALNEHERYHLKKFINHEYKALGTKWIDVGIIQSDGSLLIIPTEIVEECDRFRTMRELVNHWWYHNNPNHNHHQLGSLGKRYEETVYKKNKWKFEFKNGFWSWRTLLLIDLWMYLFVGLISLSELIFIGIKMA